MRRICVYCAANDGVRPEYLAAARQMGTVLAARGLTLLYGGARIGLMGAMADAALAGGGEVIGVMPHGLVEREVAHRNLTTLLVVDTMHERKATLATQADAFIAMPGGLGTLEELFETWTWAQLGVHRKPIGLLDVAGYWRPLVAMMDHVAAEGFLRDDPRTWLEIAETPEMLLDKISVFEPPTVRKWLRMGQT